MERTFEKLMASAGSFTHYRGYQYLHQSICLVREEPQRLCHMCLEIYQPVAQKNQTTPENVHKDIRTLRDSFWNQGGNERFVEWTGCRRWIYEKPYPKEFIAVLAQTIREIEEAT